DTPASAADVVRVHCVEQRQVGCAVEATHELRALVIEVRLHLVPAIVALRTAEARLELRRGPVRHHCRHARDLETGNTTDLDRTALDVAKPDRLRRVRRRRSEDDSGARELRETR